MAGGEINHGTKTDIVAINVREFPPLCYKYDVLCNAMGKVFYYENEESAYCIFLSGNDDEPSIEGTKAIKWVLAGAN